jgi:hypothetical protein
MSRLLDLRLALFFFPKFGEELRQAFRGEIGKTVLDAEIQVIPQPLLVEIVLNRRNGSLFHECNKERQCLRRYIEHRIFPEGCIHSICGVNRQVSINILMGYVNFILQKSLFLLHLVCRLMGRLGQRRET